MTTDQGAILLADDDKTFREATADLLRQAGYLCDEADSAEVVLAKVSERDYDLLIADINFPGNIDLQMLKSMPEEVAAIPVILVTGYPSVATAVDAIDLSVVAYLVKPFEFDSMSAIVESAIRRHRANRSILVRTTRGLADGAELKEALKHPTAVRSSESAGLFLSLTLRNIQESLGDLERLTNASLLGKPGEDACTLMGCPRKEVLRNAVQHAVAILEETRGTFKSKQLAQLRKELQAALRLDETV